MNASVPSGERIAKITLDDSGAKNRSMEAEHERTIAVTDLLHENVFYPHCLECGPYELTLSITDGRLVFDIVSPATGRSTRFPLDIKSLRSLIRDYFIICDSYYEALKTKGHGKLEAIDMGRRGIHNEASELLQELMKGRITIDFKTARRLFTLVCVLHIK